MMQYLGFEVRYECIDLRCALRLAAVAVKMQNDFFGDAWSFFIDHPCSNSQVMQWQAAAAGGGGGGGLVRDGRVLVEPQRPYQTH